MWKRMPTLIRAAGVLGCILGMSGLTAPRAWSRIGKVTFGTACFLAPSGSPHRPYECSPPPVSCQHYHYNCGLFVGVGKSRSRFQEKRYRYCYKIDSPQIKCLHSFIPKSCLSFDVYQNDSCMVKLCRGEIYYDNCFSW